MSKCEILLSSLDLTPLFLDHMVLQQRIDTAISGKATPGAEVILSASWGARASKLTNVNGDWLARLATPEATFSIGINP